MPEFRPPFRFLRDGQAGRTERGHATTSGPRFLSSPQLVERLNEGAWRIEILFRPGSTTVGRDSFQARLINPAGETTESLSGFATKEQAIVAARRRIVLATASDYRHWSSSR